MPSAEYQRGYRAGRKAGPAMTDGEFFDAALLAVLPAVLDGKNWVQADGTPITSRPQRVALARGIANNALQERRRYRPSE